MLDKHLSVRATGTLKTHQRSSRSHTKVDIVFGGHDISSRRNISIFDLADLEMPAKIDKTVSEIQLKQDKESFSINRLLNGVKVIFEKLNIGKPVGNAEWRHSQITMAMHKYFAKGQVKLIVHLNPDAIDLA